MCIARFVRLYERLSQIYSGHLDSKEKHGHPCLLAIMERSYTIDRERTTYGHDNPVYVDTPPVSLCPCLPG
jgi:hypothetical protein